MPVCYAPPIETGPNNKRGELLEPPNHTTPRRFSPSSPFLGEGGIEAEGAEKSTISYLKKYITDPARFFDSYHNILALVRV